MNIRITNVSNDNVTLFVREVGVDKRVSISPKESLIADNYETKTMIIFKRKGIITTESAQPLENQNYNLLKGKSEDELKEDEKRAITTSLEDIKDIEYFQKNLFASLKVPHETSTRFEVAEEEVAQYVEDGYIKGAWTDEDIIFLKKNYPTKGRKYCSTHLNRNETSVQKKINSLGVKKKKKK